MNAEVAQALTGDDKGGRLLLNLALNGYFVNEVQSEAGRMFQLHRLLRDFLRARAAQELPEALEHRWLQRAALLLRGAGQPEDAVALLVESRDWQEVARLVAEEAPAMLAQGRSATVAGVARAAAGGVPAARSAPAARRGPCPPARQPARRAARLRAGLRGLSRRGATRAAWPRSAGGAIDALLAEFDDLAPLDRWCAALAQGSPDAAAAATLAHALLARDPGNAALDDWIARSGDPLARAVAAMARGDLAAARAALEGLDAKALRLPAAHGGRAAAAGCRHSSLASTPRRAEAARAGLAAAESEGLHGWHAWLRMLAAAAALGRGRARRRAPRAAGDRGHGAAAPRRPRAAALPARLAGDARGRSARPRAARRRRRSRWPWRPARPGSSAWRASRSRSRWPARPTGAGARRSCAQPRTSPSARAATCCASTRASRRPRRRARRARRAPRSRRCAARSRSGASTACGTRRGGASRALAELCAQALRHGIEADYAQALVRARRLVPRIPPLRLAAWPWPFRVRALGRFELLRESAPVEFSGKGPGRPMELLKVLLANGGQEVRADQIADALWPHVDADYAHKSFTATLHRLRKLLGEDDAVLLRDGRLSLNPALVWVDAWALEQACSALDEALRAPAGAAADAGLRRARRRGASRSTAARSCPTNPSSRATSPAASRCACACCAACARLARRWEDAGQPEAAADCYLRLIEADPLFEAPYRNLMLCYQRAGDLVEARAVLRAAAHACSRRG